MHFEKEELRYLWKVYLAEFLRGIGGFMVPFMIIFLQNKSLTLAQIGILLGIVSLTNFFFEIPTGVIADKFGRKFSAILGFIISYFSFLGMIFTNSYYVLMMLYFFHGVGFTFTSGAYDAWIYEYLKSNKKEKYMHNFYSRKLGFSWIGLAISGFVAGYLVGFLDLSWLIVIDTLFGIFFLSFVVQIKDPPILNEKTYGFWTFLKTARQGLLVIRKNKNLLLLTVASVFFTVAVGARELLYQVAYIELGTPLSFLGYSFGISAIAAALVPTILFGSSKRNPKRFIVAFAILEMLLMSSIFFVSSYIVLAVLLTLFIICGTIIGPISDSIFQHNSETEVRATVSSIVNMLLSIVYSIVFLSFGLLADIYGARVILAISGFFIIPSIVCYCLIRE